MEINPEYSLGGLMLKLHRLSPRGHLERQAEFHASTQDEA